MGPRKPVGANFKQTVAKKWLPAFEKKEKN